MIAEPLIRAALDLPPPAEAAKRDAIRARVVAEVECRNARASGDTRRIHAADDAYRAAVHHLLALEAGRG